MRFIAFLLFVIPSFVHAQEVQVRSRFLADSLKIGEKVPFSVTAKYPRKLNILYPDSTYSFNPFEFESKEYFATKTNDSISYDSVVYYITSYEIDTVQVFRMPVYVLTGSDCVTVFGAADSIFLKQMVAHMPDSVSAEKLPLKTHTGYFNVEWLFNYPIAAYVTIALMVVAIIVWLVFGKRIRRYYKLRRLDKDYKDYVNRLLEAVQRVQTEYSPMNAEAALSIWKKYMERLEQKPYTKYSSKEILQLIEDANLSSALQTVDRMVYGGINSDRNVFDELAEVSKARYYDKVDKVSHE